MTHQRKEAARANGTASEDQSFEYAEPNTETIDDQGWLSEDSANYRRKAFAKGVTDATLKPRPWKVEETRTPEQHRAAIAKIDAAKQADKRRRKISNFEPLGDITTRVLARFADE